jgi:hypothetical protein
MEMFTATGKLIFFLFGQLEMFNVRSMGGTAHIDILHCCNDPDAPMLTRVWQEL